MLRPRAAILTLLIALAGYAPSFSADPKFEAYLKQIDEVVNRGPFKADWKSLENFQVPAWYIDGKFGIFIHWGAYSVPAFGNEWYPRNMYVAGSKEFKHQVETYGPQSRFGYKDFLPMFKAEKFDAASWAKLLRESGAKYVVRWPSTTTVFHVRLRFHRVERRKDGAEARCPRRTGAGDPERGPGVRRLVAPGRALVVLRCRYEIRLRCARSSVRGVLWSGKGPEGRREPARTADQEFLEDWLVRSCQIVDKYQPQLIWFDWWIAQPPVHPYLRKFAAYYYNRGAEWKKGVAINYKKHGGESFPDGAGVLDIERGQLAVIRPYFWQTDTSVSKNSWGYVKNQDYKTVDSLVDDLVDIVSKNGALLLNIGPKPDGTIPEPEQEMLLEIGRWLKVNGASIYGTRPWRVYGEGPTRVVEGPFGDTKRKPFTGRTYDSLPAATCFTRLRSLGLTAASS